MAHSAALTKETMSKRLAALGFCMFITACSTQPNLTVKQEATAEERLNEAKLIIEAESATFFDPSANARNIAISALRDIETPIGVRSGVCLRANVTNRAGKEMGTQVYLVTFDKGHIFQRQIAEPKHGCGGQRFNTVLTFKPAVPLEASKSMVSRGH